jgi:hypothetical protein
MNTKPDETALALWLDDELTGPDAASIEAWAAGQPELLESRDEVRKWRTMIATAIPAVEEPPYPDFFNSRIQQAIRETSKPAPAAAKSSSGWRFWRVPLAACAGMALAFWVGKETHSRPNLNVVHVPHSSSALEPVVYTPESGVNAQWFSSSDASATVVVLDGISAIPDTMDFSNTVSSPTPRLIDSTADISDHALQGR